jgi:hypothetical protein
MKRNAMIVTNPAAANCVQRRVGGAKRAIGEARIRRIRWRSRSGARMAEGPQTREWPIHVREDLRELDRVDGSDAGAVTAHAPSPRHPCNPPDMSLEVLEGMTSQLIVQKELNHSTIVIAAAHSIASVPAIRG